MLARPRASFARVGLVRDLFGELQNALRGKPCLPVAADLMFLAGTGRLLAYPDVMVFCEPVWR